MQLCHSSLYHSTECLRRSNPSSCVHLVALSKGSSNRVQHTCGGLYVLISLNSSTSYGLAAAQVSWANIGINGKHFIFTFAVSLFICWGSTGNEMCIPTEWEVYTTTSTQTVILALYMPQKAASETIGMSASSLEIIRDRGDVRQLECTRANVPVQVRVLLRPARPDIRHVQLWCADSDR
jgi:hypothetical protein